MYKNDNTLVAIKPVGFFVAHSFFRADLAVDTSGAGGYEAPLRDPYGNAHWLLLLVDENVCFSRFSCLVSLFIQAVAAAAWAVIPKWTRPTRWTPDRK